LTFVLTILIEKLKSLNNKKTNHIVRLGKRRCEGKKYHERIWETKAQYLAVKGTKKFGSQGESCNYMYFLFPFGYQ